MSIINMYGDATITNWEIDDNGNKVSIPILNEAKQVIGNKFVLEGIPDEQYRVFIDGLVEINIKEKITELNQFKVDYRKYGAVFVHPSLDGQWLNVSKYSSRGLIFIPSSRVWTKVDDFGNVLETLDGAIAKIDLVSDIIIGLDESINAATILKSELDAYILNGNTLKMELPLLIDTANTTKVNLDGSVGSANLLKTNLDGSIVIANDKKLELDLSVSSATNINSTLSGNISVATTKDNDLKATVISANTSKSDLDISVISANSSKSNLDGSISTASTTKTGLDSSIIEGGILKSELDGIIAGSDFEGIVVDIASLKIDQHNHTNKVVLDGLSDVSGKLGYNNLPIGSGDMAKSIYDTNDNGKVDIAEDSEKLGGQLPIYYAKQSDMDNKVDNSRVLTDVPLNAKFTDTITPIANTLTETVVGKVLDATQGKVLDDRIGILSTKVSEVEYSELSSTATNMDSEGIYLNTEWKRKNNTLYAKSTLLGTSPNYNQIKMEYYNDAGTTVIKTITWNIAYDNNDFPHVRTVV